MIGLATYYVLRTAYAMGRLDLKCNNYNTLCIAHAMHSRHTYDTKPQKSPTEHRPLASLRIPRGVAGVTKRGSAGVVRYYGYGYGYYGMYGRGGVERCAGWG